MLKSRTLWFICLTAVLWCTRAGVLAQAPANPTFEVASIKPNKSGDGPFGIDIQPGGRFIASNLPLKQLIRAAHTLQLYQIVDAPGWVDADRFDVTAVAGRDITVTTPWMPGSTFLLVQLMMQSLLADRFHMVAHSEKRESNVYSLVVDNAHRQSAESLKPAAADCGTNCGMHGTGIPGTLRGRNVPLPTLAEFLSQITGRLVTDASGLSGTFDIDLHWMPDGQQNTSGDAPSIFTALQEQLGLKLQPGRGPVDVLVVDHIEHPTEN